MYVYIFVCECGCASRWEYVFGKNKSVCHFWIKKYKKGLPNVVYDKKEQICLRILADWE